MPDPLKMMSLPADATPADVHARWRVIAIDLHPDKGGSVEDFQKANEIFYQALAFAQQPRTCVICKGMGKTHKMEGFTPIYTDCISCDGSGKVILK